MLRVSLDYTLNGREHGWIGLTDRHLRRMMRGSGRRNEYDKLEILYQIKMKLERNGQLRLKSLQVGEEILLTVQCTEYLYRSCHIDN